MTKVSLVCASFTFFVVLPLCLHNFGENSLLIVIVSFFLNTLLFANKQGIAEIQKAYYFDHCNEKYSKNSLEWLRLLSQGSRLSATSSVLGTLLATFHGAEDTNYHLFPAIPSLMPTTILFFITILFIFGLESSSFFRTLLNILFISVSFLFFILGLFSINFEADILGNDIFQIFVGVVFFLPCFTALENEKGLLGLIVEFGLYLAGLGMLSQLKKNKMCAGQLLIRCFNEHYPWYEPLSLALSICCLGLSLPELFMAALNSAHNIPLLVLFLYDIASSRVRQTLIILVGIISILLIMTCPTYFLVLLSGSSFIIEQLFLIIFTIYRNVTRDVTKKNIITNRKKINSVVHKNEEESNLLKSGISRSSESEDEPLSDSIVQRKTLISYKAFLKFDEKAKEKYCIKNILLAMITLELAIISLVLQLKMYFVAISLFCVSGVMMLLFTLYLSNKNKTYVSLSLLVLTINIILSGSFTLEVWIALVIWLTLGLFLHCYNKYRNCFKKSNSSNYQLSIREEPPKFETFSVSPPVKKKFFGKVIIS